MAQRNNTYALHFIEVSWAGCADIVIDRLFSRAEPLSPRIHVNHSQTFENYFKRIFKSTPNSCSSLPKVSKQGEAINGVGVWPERYGYFSGGRSLKGSN